MINVSFRSSNVHILDFQVVVSYIGPPPLAQIVSVDGALLVGAVEGITPIVVIVGLEEGVVLIGDVVDGIVVPMDVLTS